MSCIFLHFHANEHSNLLRHNEEKKIDNEFQILKVTCHSIQIVSLIGYRTLYNAPPVILQRLFFSFQFLIILSCNAEKAN